MPAAQEQAVPVPDRDRALGEAAAAVARFCALLHGVGDVDRPAVGHWTVRDVGAHVAEAMRLYTALLAGDPSPAATIDAVPAMNEAGVRAVPDRDPRALAAGVEAAAGAYLAAARERPADHRVTWHAGLRVPVTTLVALTIGEAAVHGRDVARATGAAWTVPAPWAHTVFRGLLPVVPSYLDATRAAGVSARFDVRLRGEDGTRVVLAVDGGRLAVAPAGSGPVDCVLSADPVAFLLILYGRTGPVRPALAGRIAAWGRRPWLGPVLPGLFHRP